MKNPRYSTRSEYTRPYRSVFFILLFIVSATVSVRSQTLFEIAIQLDSLYDQIKTDSAAAEPFFNALRKVYDFEGDFQPAAIKKDIEGNRFLQPIVGLAYQQLNLVDDNKDGRLTELTTTRDSIFQVCSSMINTLCYNNEDNCKFRESLRAFDNNIYYKYFAINELEGLINQVKEPEETSKVLKKLLLEATAIELEMSELQQTNESVFIQNQKAIDIMPTGSTATSTAIAPIIIQNQGGGSAQSAIIDGTAKWIAERMRQELSIAFFDRFEDWAEEKSISYLFPNTLAVLQTSANADYTLMMEVYKNAFNKDLNQLIFNLPIFLEKELVDENEINGLIWDMAYANFKIDSLNTAYDRYFQTYQFRNPYENWNINIVNGDTMLSYKTEAELMAADEKFFSYQKYAEKREMYSQMYWERSNSFQAKRTFKYINFTLDAIDQLKNGTHPSTLLTYLNNNSVELFRHNPRLKSSLLLLDVLSQSLTKVNEEKNTVWVGKEEIKKLRDDAQFRSIFFGLIHYKIKQIIRSEKRLWETNYDYYSNSGYAIQNMIYNKRSIINDFYKYARGPIYTNRSDINNAYLARNWETIIDQYEPSDSLLLANYDKAAAKDMLGYILNAYNIEIGYRSELFTYDPEGYKSAMNRFKYDLDNAIDTIRTLCDESNPQFPSNTFENAAGIFRQLYTLSPKDLFTVPEGYEEYPPLIDIDNIENSSFLVSVGEPISHLYKSPDDWTNKIYPLLVQMVDQRSVIYQQYSGYQKAFNSIEEKISNDYYKNVILADSLQMVMANKSYNQNAIWNELEIKLLENTQLELDALILGEWQQKRFGKIINNFIQFASRIDQINAEFKTLKAADKANFGNQEFFFLIKNSVDALDLVFELTIDDPVAYQNIKFITENILDAYQAGLNKNYNELVMNIIPVVKKIVTEKYQVQIDTLVQRDLKLNGLNQFQVIDLPKNPTRDSLKLLLDDKMRKMQEVFKYATFAAAVAESQNSDDVKKAIQAIALPVGSYSIKRRTFSNISLQAYPGITGGLELIQNGDFSEWAPNFGFTAPIGVSVNWGYRAKRNKKKYARNLNYQKRIQRSERGLDDKYFTGHSGSFFFSFIDLGALVLFRLNDADEPLPEDVGFKQVFSPGVSYVHGLPRVPISIMSGFQMTPELRTIGEDTKANSFRFNISVVVDLPIANFHTRRREKR